jgi:hypothetical protein
VARTGDDAVRKNGDGELLEVIRKAIIAPVEESAGLRGALEHQCATRTDSQSEQLSLARAIDDVESIVVEAGIDFYVSDGFLHRQNFADVRQGFQSVERIVADAFAQNFTFGFVRRVAHLDTHQKTVELRFGQWIGAVMLDWILRSDNEKGLRKRESFAVDGDLRFVHGFQERGLRARRGAIDLVRKYDVGENGAGTEFKFARFGIVDTYAENIAGQQIGSELDALKRAMKRFRKGLGEGGLAHAGNVFDEQVAARQQGDQRKLNGVFLTVDRARDGALQLRNDLRCGRWHWLKTRVLPDTNSDYGRLAQLVRALPSHGRGQRFKSFVAHHLLFPRQKLF